jgi:hypothetical protein
MAGAVGLHYCDVGAQLIEIVDLGLLGLKNVRRVASGFTPVGGPEGALSYIAWDTGIVCSFVEWEEYGVQDVMYRAASAWGG